MMSIQGSATMRAAEAGRNVAREVVGGTIQAAEYAKDQTQEFMQTTYNMFTDPEVQKHFMSMGIEFMAGMSALMRKAPIPSFVKDSATGMEENWKQTTCRKNDQCAVKRAKARKVEVEVDPDGPEGPQQDVPVDEE